jgi:Protein of unknown function (DUF1186)/SEC-C motif
MARSSVTRAVQPSLDSAMTDAEVIQALTVCRKAEFPYGAVRAVLAAPEQFADRLLAAMRMTPQELEAAHDADEEENAYYFLDTFATYILVQLRDPRAFDALISYYSTPGSLASDLTGDFVTEHLNAALARVYNGDLGALTSLIENENAYVFARNAALDALGCLMVMGKLDEQWAVDYAAEKLDAVLATERADDFTTCLVNFALDMRSPQLRARVDRCFELDLVDRMWVGVESVEQAYAAPPEDRHAEFRQLMDFPNVFDDLSNWPFFRKPEPKPKFNFRGREITQTISIRRGTVILDAEGKCGRNDPCPCGSGSKYKKCCIA